MISKMRSIGRFNMQETPAFYYIKGLFQKPVNSNAEIVYREYAFTIPFIIARNGILDKMSIYSHWEVWR